MGRHATNVERPIIFTLCVCKEQEVPSLRISIIQELPDEALESDKLFAVEEVGPLKHEQKGQFFVPLCFIHKQGSSIIECQLDTGATSNVMSIADLCTVLHTQNPPLKPKPSQLRCYNSSVINTLGHCTLQCCYNTKTSH